MPSFRCRQAVVRVSWRSSPWRTPSQRAGSSILAPTNALAHQIRRDLTRALAAFRQVRVSAFVGGTEYTALSEDQLKDESFVGVMTPEKCASHCGCTRQCLRNARSACSMKPICSMMRTVAQSQTSSLHSSFASCPPSMRLLLMSAMVSNAEELAAWLSSVRKGDAIASKIKWRPSRAARGFVFVDEKPLEEAIDSGRKALALGSGAKKVDTKIPLGWIAGLSGPWTHDGPADYRTVRLPISAEFYAKRSKKGQRTFGFSSWKNRTGLNRRVVCSSWSSGDQLCAV